LGAHTAASFLGGGTGLDLTAADCVVYLDLWWDPAVEDQASDRAHRIDQDRPVTIYRLIMRTSSRDVSRACTATSAASRRSCWTAHTLLAASARRALLI
jgi:hypothetical protein